MVDEVKTAESSAPEPAAWRDAFTAEQLAVIENAVLYAAKDNRDTALVVIGKLVGLLDADVPKPAHSKRAKN